MGADSGVHVRRREHRGLHENHKSGNLRHSKNLFGSRKTVSKDKISNVLDKKQKPRITGRSPMKETVSIIEKKRFRRSCFD